MSDSSPKAGSWLSVVNLSDPYERKARLAPALLCVVMMLPSAIAFGIELGNWISVVATGLGLGAAIALGMSHLASAMGNRFQRKLWPRWPHDSPTNEWLDANDTSRSQQQKAQWYAAVQRLTGLDIAADSVNSEAVINDAVSQLRNQLWKSSVADRLRTHNMDFGFARNFSGMHLIWVPATTLGAIACWIGVYTQRVEIMWAVIATVLAVFAVLISRFILPQYVHRKAEHYADSFFAAVLTMNSERQTAAAESKVD